MGVKAEKRTPGFITPIHLQVLKGNRLTLEQVAALADNKEIIATEKDKKEVLNYLEALDSIQQYASKKNNRH